MASASQRMREELKTHYSCNDLDQLNRQVALENRLVAKTTTTTTTRNRDTLELGWKLLCDKMLYFTHLCYCEAYENKFHLTLQLLIDRHSACSESLSCCRPPGAIFRLFSCEFRATHRRSSSLGSEVTRVNEPCTIESIFRDLCNFQKFAKNSFF